MIYLKCFSARFVRHQYIKQEMEARSQNSLERLKEIREFKGSVQRQLLRFLSMVRERIQPTSVPLGLLGGSRWASRWRGSPLHKPQKEALPLALQPPGHSAGIKERLYLFILLLVLKDLKRSANNPAVLLFAVDQHNGNIYTSQNLKCYDNDTALLTNYRRGTILKDFINKTVLTPVIR